MAYISILDGCKRLRRHDSHKQPAAAGCGEFFDVSPYDAKKLSPIEFTVDERMG